MQNDTGNNKPARPPGNKGKSKSADGKTPTSPQYTARQREKMQKGLRILANVIVRAHLRRQAELADPD